MVQILSLILVEIINDTTSSLESVILISIVMDDRIAQNFILAGRPR